ncbi:MAG: serine/threonine-protein kinase, partial [Bacteroidota bacterium]
MQENLTYSAFESRYRERDFIGSGGFAKVYKVFDHANNRYVALKVSDVRPDWKKFTLRREVELVNSLPPHQNIVRYDACYRFNRGITGEMDFAILEFSEEGNLEQFLNRKQLTAKEKKIIVRGILDGIAFLHRNGVIHRDLKAQNILIYRESGVWMPKITDFGLGRYVGEGDTITNSAIGLSYAYAAPEQIQNEKIYKNVDLWAIGVIIYRIMVGELPFVGRSGGDGRSAQSQLELSKKIVNLDLPYEKLNRIEEPYRRIIKYCLVKKPAQRVESAEVLIDLLNGNHSDHLSSQNENTVPVTPSTPNVEETQRFFQSPKGKEPEVDYNPQPAAPSISTPPVIPDYETPPNYNSPNQNPTQVIHQGSSELINNIPPEPPLFEERIEGGDKKSFNWVWVFVPLILMLTGGSYLMYGDFFKAETKTSQTSSNELVLIGKNKKEPVNNNTFKFVEKYQTIGNAKA